MDSIYDGRNFEREEEQAFDGAQMSDVLYPEVVAVLTVAILISNKVQVHHMGCIEPRTNMVSSRNAQV